MIEGWIQGWFCDLEIKFLRWDIEVLVKGLRVLGLISLVKKLKAVEMNKGLEFQVVMKRVFLKSNIRLFSTFSSLSSLLEAHR